MLKVDLLIKNATVVTVDSQRRILENAFVAITEDKIVAIDSSDRVAEYSGTRVYDAAGKIVYPGFINTHTHLFQYMLKGLGRDKLLFEWLNASVRRALANYDPKTCYYAAQAACIEALRSGVTSNLDFMYAHTHVGVDDAVIEAMSDLGMRNFFGRSHTDTSGMPEEFGIKWHETEQMFLDDVRRLAKKHREDDMISIVVAPGIIWDATADGYREMRQIADQYDLPLTMHIQETKDDDEYSLATWGKRTFPFLEEVGFLGPDLIAVHCVQLEEEDIDLIKQHDVKVCHCPLPNMLLASGIAPIERLRTEGVTVSLGVDGAASNDKQDMLEVIKMTSLLQKVNLHDASALPAAEVLAMATINGALSLGREDDLGGLEVGKKADLFIYDPMTPTSIPVHEPVSSLVYASSPANIESVIVNGKFVLDRGEITTIDEEKVLFEANRLAKDLVSKSGLTPKVAHP